MGKRKHTNWTDILPIAIVLSIVLAIAGAFLSEIILAIVDIDSYLMPIIQDADTLEFLQMYASNYGIWIVFILVALIPKLNRPMMKAAWYHRGGNTIRGALIGLLLGFGFNGICILFSCILGDIKLSFNRFSPVLFFAFLLAVLIQSGAEELVDRCYLYQKLRRRYRHPAVAIFVNAAAFAAMHLLNPGITAVSVIQIALIGVIFSLFVYYYDSLWAAIMMHTGWNFTQSIVFGLPNSGIVSKYSLFKLDAASARDGIFYNVGFGVEGSIGAVTLLTILLIAVFLIGRKNGEKKDYWK